MNATESGVSNLVSSGQCEPDFDTPVDIACCSERVACKQAGAKQQAGSENEPITAGLENFHD
jgi:hypothetical protein